MAAKREWYIAYGEAGGEYAGNPLAFDAAQVYGPFTEAQARELVGLVQQFPHETKDATYVKVSKASFRSVKTMIVVDLEAAKSEAAQEAE